MSTEIRSWDEDLTTRERVRLVARSLSEPRTASWIAEEADVAHGTAKKYLEQLVGEHEVVESDLGGTVTYYPDRITQYLEEVRDLFEDHTEEELTASIAEMKDQIREWQDEFDVESPNELRASIGETDIGPDAEARRREIASEWKYLQYRIDVVTDTLSLYDRFDEHRRQPPTA
jgi:predicted ArsR family transcriptional regulator